jgi:hypothetical protein
MASGAFREDESRRLTAAGLKDLKELRGRGLGWVRSLTSWQPSLRPAPLAIA